MKRFKVEIWIPVIVALIGSFTTVAVTYINASVKASSINERRAEAAMIEQRISVPAATSSGNTGRLADVMVRLPSNDAKVRISLTKGIYVETNR